MDIETAEMTAHIRELNDTLRTTFDGGEIVFTASFTELPSMVKAADSGTCKRPLKNS